MAGVVLDQGAQEFRQLPMRLQSSEAGLRLHHASGGPPQGHRGIAPALHVACHVPDRALHVLDGVGAGQRAAQLGR